jgi:hypothetical protein
MKTRSHVVALALAVAASVWSVGVHAAKTQPTRWDRAKKAVKGALGNKPLRKKIRKEDVDLILGEKVTRAVYTTSVNQYHYSIRHKLLLGEHGLRIVQHAFEDQKGDRVPSSGTFGLFDQLRVTAPVEYVRLGWNPLSARRRLTSEEWPDLSAKQIKENIKSMLGKSKN